HAAVERLALSFLQDEPVVRQRRQQEDATRQLHPRHDAVLEAIAASDGLRVERQRVEHEDDGAACDHCSAELDEARGDPSTPISEDADGQASDAKFDQNDERRIGERVEVHATLSRFMRRYGSEAAPTGDSSRSACSPITLSTMLPN